MTRLPLPTISPTTLPELVPPDVVQRFPNDQMAQINSVLKDNPLLFDSYLSDATEVDVDALCRRQAMFLSAASWSTSRKPASIPATAPAPCRHTRCRPRSSQSSSANPRALRSPSLNVVGLINVQFAIKGDDIYVLEVNPRASRTVPFVAKTIGTPIAKIAARIMAGEPLASFGLSRKPIEHTAVKEAVFPVCPVPRGRHRAWPGDALDRRGHGVSTTPTVLPLRRASSAVVPTCQHPAPRSSRSRMRTRNAFCRRRAN